jgi:hypothetical protein
MTSEQKSSSLLLGPYSWLRLAGCGPLPQVRTKQQDTTMSIWEWAIPERNNGRLRPQWPIGYSEKEYCVADIPAVNIGQSAYANYGPIIGGLEGPLPGGAGLRSHSV